MDILEKFGIEGQLLVAQIVNFLIIFFVLKRFLYKPIFNLLKKREENIKEGIKKAEEGQKALVDAAAKEKKLIKDAQETARKIVSDAREQAVIVAKEIEEKAKKHSDQMIEDAKVQIELDAKKAEQKLYKQISTLSIELLKKALPDVFTQKEQTEIVSRAVKDLGKRAN